MIRSLEQKWHWLMVAAITGFAFGIAFAILLL
jgi:tetrahydromethanopterin S-methyltransferase subunit F